MSQSSARNAWARGGTVFAAIMLMIVGVFQVFEGIAAIVHRAYFAVSPNYVFRINVIGWGWIHLGIGIVVALTGFFLLFSGGVLARGLGIFFATISALANFLWLPYYPVWAIVLIAIDIFVIWSLAVVRPADM
jgi:hypothetical protein